MTWSSSDKEAYVADQMRQQQLAQQRLAEEQQRAYAEQQRHYQLEQERTRQLQANTSSSAMYQSSPPAYTNSNANSGYAHHSSSGTANCGAFSGVFARWAAGLQATACRSLVLNMGKWTLIVCLWVVAILLGIIEVALIFLFAFARGFAGR